MFTNKSKLIIIIIMFFAITQLVIAGNIGNSNGYVWAEKFGWISLSGGGASVDYGVTVGDASLAGYAWSEITGWINFNDSGDYYGVTNDGAGNLSGHAWSEKLGYISFDDTSANNFYQVTLDEFSENIQSGTVTLRTGTTLRTDTKINPGKKEADNYLSGYAWSELGGYINMDDEGDLYKPRTEWN